MTPCKAGGSGIAGGDGAGFAGIENGEGLFFASEQDADLGADRREGDVPITTTAGRSW